MFSQRFSAILIVAALAIFGSKANGQQYVYGAGTVPLGPTAPKMVSADFNGDGFADLAILSQGTNLSSVVSVILSRPDGTLGPRVDYSVGSSVLPGSLAVGDLNGDGKLDLIVTNENVAAVYIFMGNGDGSFNAPTSFSEPSLLSIAAVTAVDFNKDGKADLAFAGTNLSNAAVVAVALGNGGGTFQAAKVFNVASAYTIAAGDVNGDGVPDLVVGGGYSGSSGTISVLLGVGDGTFNPYTSYSVSGGDVSVALADMNSDGELDIVAVSYVSSAAGVSVLLGNGDGTFGSAIVSFSDPVSFPDLTFLSSVTVADFSGDGKADVVVASSTLNCVEVLLGNGDGTVGKPVQYGVAPSPPTVLAADFNHDGKMDIAALGNFPAAADVTILLGQGNGNFVNESEFPAPAYPYDMTVGDFNGDGRPDVALTNFDSPGSVSVELNDGNGGFQISAAIAVGNYPTYLASGDFNQDGKLDLVFSDTDPATQQPRLGMLLGNGDGTFAAPIYRSVSFVQGKFAVADFNRDGKLDIASTEDIAGMVDIYLGHGDGTFADPVSYATVASPTRVFAADFNGDGFPDLAIAGQNGGTSVLMNNGDGTFQAQREVSTQDILSAVGDFNNDGKEDLLIAGSGITMLLGNGDGTFQAGAIQTLVDGTGSDMQVADFDGDGNLDIAFITDHMGIILGNGDGTFGERIDYLAPSSPFSLATADFQGTGGSDILLGAAGTSSSTGMGTFMLYSNPPVLSVFPSSLQFAAQFVGSASGPQNLTLTNRTAAELNLSGVATSGDFTEQNNCGSQLQPGKDCTVSVSLNPSTIGEISGVLKIQYGASSARSISLSGFGKAFTITSTSSSATINAGQTASFPVEVNPTGGTTGVVSLSCSGAPANAVCSLTPASVTLDGSDAASATVKVTTASASANGMSPYPGSAPKLDANTGRCGLAFAVLLGLLLYRKQEHSKQRFGIFLCCTLAIAMVSCGGGGSNGGGTPPPGNPGTPAGTYTLTITGQAASSGATLTEETKLTLVVK